jgi:CheY-like chemotaxis protein
MHAHDPTHQPRSAAPRRVLLVDDDPDYVLSMRTRLQAAGYDVTTAESVAEARVRLDEALPDAAIIDLMMEEPDGGFGLCFQIKKRNRAIPVIMVSAVTSETGLDFGTATDAERAWIKADAFLAKPVRFEQLQRELDRLLQA